MELIKRTTLHFQDSKSDKIYEVDLCRVGEDRYLVNFRHGRRGTNLKEGTKTTQAVSLVKAEKIFNKLVADKTKKGYQDISEPQTNTTPSKKASHSTSDSAARDRTILERLENPDDKKWSQSRAIWRAGELKLKDATPLLIPLIGTDKPLRDYSIAWSLGWCGDRSAVPILTELHENPSTPEFVKRIAWEALFKLADEPGKVQMRVQKIEELPTELQDLARSGSSEALSETLNSYLNTPFPIDSAVTEFQEWLQHCKWFDWREDEGVRTEINDRIAQLPEEWRSRIPELPEPQGKRYFYRSLPRDVQWAIDNYIHQEKPQLFAILDTLYQIDNEQTRPAILEVVRNAPFTNTYFFQRLRHIFKMAEYRQDIEVFSHLAYRFSKVKGNGYYARSYGGRTREYLRRRVWRTLRTLAEDGDALYLDFAVAILLQYSDADAEEPRTSTYYRWDWENSTSTTYTRTWDSFAAYLTFNHILYENSPRYLLANNTKAWRCRDNYKPGDPEPQRREEAFPELWEQRPDALLRLLLESHCRPVHHFAAKALRACTRFCEEIELETLMQLLNKPYEVTVQLGFELIRERYNPDNPNLELVQALANCAFESARTQAHEWIDAAKEFFLSSTQFITSLVLSSYGDTRLFARNLLSHSILPDDTAKVLIGRILMELLAFDSSEGKSSIIKDAGETLVLCFSPQLRTLGCNVIQDLLEHPIAEVQEIGARILLNHETPTTELPSGLIDSLITSPYEAIRGIGVQLFGQLPNETLLQDYDLLCAIASNALPDLRQSIRPIIQRLATAYPDFALQLATELINLLLLPERHDGIHPDLVLLLRDFIPGWMGEISREMAMKLLRAKSSATQELGGLVLSTHCNDWVSDFSVPEIVKLASHEIVAVREATRSMFAQKLDSIRTHPQELLSAVRLLEAKWEDSRLFARDIFNTFSSEEWTPEVMVSICDSVREDVRQFGRNLVINNFQQEYGQDYLLKFSEHPSADMQIFATNYLEEYAKGQHARLRQLTPYFVTVLSQVNRSRVAKDRVLAFLEEEAQNSEESARIVAEILTQQSLTRAIGDKAKTIETMLKIARKYPEIELPLRVI
ncbi:HEAT repeat domain-containing protein [Lusitaniella coriacea]|uniref:HEAT repeat domain-containing protein n=1 Tax=Lusitaniella coriacea TaxID=1983105 RepID=UPI003CF514A0